MPVDFCNWCPDPHNPSPAHHPGGGARHEMMPQIRRPIPVHLLPFQVKLLEQVTGKLFRSRLCCVDCYGEEFRDDTSRSEKMCVKCDSPYPPVMLFRAQEVGPSS